MSQTQTPTPPENGERQPPGILREWHNTRHVAGGIMSEDNARAVTGDIPVVLPHERVFRIQIGSELFTLSGASLSSDAPSYFSQYFLCQLEQARQNEAAGQDRQQIKTLYIDRDPVTFRDICRHLQGYHVAPRDGAHFVKLFADAQFYALPRLIDQLYEDNIYISIGHREFHVQKSLFTAPGDTPNYFTLGFGFMFAAPPRPNGPSEIFPGLSREGLLRPPSIVPPSVPGRSADIFAELVEMLKGYEVHIRNNEHRMALLRDAGYFRFRGLEQRLIPHRIERNLVTGREEIGIRLEDIRQSGVRVWFDLDQGMDEHGREKGQIGTVQYSRPFVDKKPYSLVLEVADECTKLEVGKMIAFFQGGAKNKITKLVQLIADKASDDISQRSVGQLQDGLVGVDLEGAAITLDGKEITGKGTRELRIEDGADPLGPVVKKRKLDELGREYGAETTWNIRRGQWRLEVRPGMRLNGRISYRVVLIAVKLEAFTEEKDRNKLRTWLC